MSSQTQDSQQGTGHSTFIDAVVTAHSLMHVSSQTQDWQGTGHSTLIVANVNGKKHRQETDHSQVFVGQLASTADAAKGK